MKKKSHFKLIIFFKQTQILNNLQTQTQQATLEGRVLTVLLLRVWHKEELFQKLKIVLNNKNKLTIFLIMYSKTVLISDFFT